MTPPWTKKLAPILIAALLAPFASGAEYTLYSNDFSAGALDGFAPYGGASWSASGAEARKGASGEGALHLEAGPYPRPFAIEADVLFYNTPANGVGKHAALLATTHLAGRLSAGYQIDWIDRAGDRGWRFTVANGNGGYLTTIYPGPDALQGQAQRWRLEIGVSDISFSVDGVPVFTQSDATYDALHAGMWGWFGNDVAFDDLVVRGFDDLAPVVALDEPQSDALYVDGANVGALPGATVVVGTVNVVVSAGDEAGGSGLSKIELFVDGALVAESATSPLEHAWDTLAEMPGEHVLEARATDAAGNVASVERTVTTL